MQESDQHQGKRLSLRQAALEKPPEALRVYRTLPRSWGKRVQNRSALIFVRKLRSSLLRI
jgi:hypothetical protein